MFVDFRPFQLGSKNAVNPIDPSKKRKPLTRPVLSVREDLLFVTIEIAKRVSPKKVKLRQNGICLPHKGPERSRFYAFRSAFGYFFPSKPVRDSVLTFA